jgi:hypothetical protein
VELSKLMIELGEAHGCPVVALMTAMDRPLGRACGNALEVEPWYESAVQMDRLGADPAGTFAFGGGDGGAGKAMAARKSREFLASSWTSWVLNACSCTAGTSGSGSWNPNRSRKLLI